MAKGYTINEQYHYHCRQSKKGAVNMETGEILSDFARGMHLGKAKQIASSAKLSRKIRGLPPKYPKRPRRTRYEPRSTYEEY